MQLKSGVLCLGGNLTTTGVTMSGSSAGTVLQLMNVKTVSNASTQTTAYAAIGVTPGTALENFALTSHRWWTGSSGTNSGAIGMQLASGALTIGGNTCVGGTVSTTALAFSGTVNGTLVQPINSVSTVSGTIVTTAFAGLGITAVTAVDNYSLNGHRWWTGSSGLHMRAARKRSNFKSRPLRRSRRVRREGKFEVIRPVYSLRKGSFKKRLSGKVK